MCVESNWMIRVISAWKETFGWENCSLSLGDMGGFLKKVTSEGSSWWKEKCSGCQEHHEERRKDGEARGVCSFLELLCESLVQCLRHKRCWEETALSGVKSLSLLALLGGWATSWWCPVVIEDFGSEGKELVSGADTSKGPVFHILHRSRSCRN